MGWDLSNASAGLGTGIPRSFRVKDEFLKASGNDIQRLRLSSTFFKFKQFSNAKSPTFCTLRAIIFLSVLQFSNAEYEISCAHGAVISWSAMQFLKVLG